MTEEKSNDQCCDCNECDCSPSSVPDYYEAQVSGATNTVHCNLCDNVNGIYGLSQIPCIPCAWYQQGGGACDAPYPECEGISLIQIEFTCEVVDGVQTNEALVFVVIGNYHDTVGSYTWRKTFPGPLDCQSSLTFTGTDIDVISGTPTCNLSGATLTFAASDTYPCGS